MIIENLIGRQRQCKAFVDKRSRWLSQYPLRIKCHGFWGKSGEPSRTTNQVGPACQKQLSVVRLGLPDLTAAAGYQKFVGRTWRTPHPGCN